MKSGFRRVFNRCPASGFPPAGAVSSALRDSSSVKYEAS